MGIPACVRPSVPLAPYTTFGIGGPAKWLAEPVDTAGLLDSLAFAAEQDARVLMLGGGSNLLISDEQIDALVLHLSPKGEFGRIQQDESNPLVWTIGAAVPLQQAVGETARHGIAGLEHLAGIPGTIGGAIAMNCGTADQGIGSVVEQARVFSLHGESVIMSRDQLVFGYRRSNIRGMVATEFILTLTGEEAPNVVVSRMRDQRERKRASQPMTIPSCGCIFKNPPGDSAGALIDASGCKGMRINDAEVSSIHANFIVNQGHATCRDVAALACQVRDAVTAETGIVLEPEVVFWGPPDEFGCFGDHKNVDN